MVNFRASLKVIVKAVIEMANKTGNNVDKI